MPIYKGKLSPLYKELEYLSTDESQYFDLGFKGNQNTRIELDCKFNKTGSAVNSRVFGDRLSSSSAGFCSATWSGYASGNSTIFGQLGGTQYQNSSSITATALKTRMVISLDKTTLRWGTNYYKTFSYSGTFETSRNLLLCDYYTGSTLREAHSPIDVYGLKHYESNVLVNDFVAVKRTTDNVIGLYDKLTKTFIQKVEGNALTGGEETGNTYGYDITSQPYALSIKKPTYQILDRVQANNNQYINLDYYPSDKTCLEIKFILTSHRQGQAIYGNYTSSWTNKSFNLYTGASSNVTYNGFNDDINVSNYVNLALNTEYVIKQDGRYLYSDDVLKYTHSASTFTATNKLKIFRTGGSHEFSGYCYFIKISEEGTLIYDLVPVRRIEDGKVGFYNKVDGSFIVSNGSDFIAGTPTGQIIYHDEVETIVDGDREITL